MSMSLNNDLFKRINRTLSESGPEHEKIASLRADTSHNLRMYYSKLQVAKAHELLAQHGEPEEAEFHNTRATRAMNQASDHHSQAAAYHNELCSQGGQVHAPSQGEDFTGFKKQAREHIGYKE